MAVRSLPRFDPAVLRRHRRRNALRTVLLIAAVVGLLALLGWLVAGIFGLIVLAVGSALYLGSKQHAPLGLVLRWMRAQPVAPGSGLARAVTTLARRAELPRPPHVFVLPRGDLNAMAMGTPEQPVVAVTQGLLRYLDDRELIGVLAHEVSHLAHGDLKLLAVFDAAAKLTHSLFWLGGLSLLLGLPLLIDADGVRWLTLALLAAAPMAVMALRFAASRMREFGADLGAVQLTSDPLGLASALTKLERFHDQLRRWTRWRQRLPDAEVEPVPEWLRTHPATQTRVQRLLEFYDPAPAAA